MMAAPPLKAAQPGAACCSPPTPPPAHTAHTHNTAVTQQRAPAHARARTRTRTSLDLGVVLDAVVGLAAAQEVLTAAAGLDVLDAHVQALADDAAVDLDMCTGGVCDGACRDARAWSGKDQGVCVCVGGGELGANTPRAHAELLLRCATLLLLLLLLPAVLLSTAATCSCWHDKEPATAALSWTRHCRLLTPCAQLPLAAAAGAAAAAAVEMRAAEMRAAQHAQPV
jgi:hypothetical protein